MRMRSRMEKQKSWKSRLYKQLFMLVAVCLLLCNGLVQFAMVQSLYDAAGGEKMLLVEGGAHALSRQAAPELYYVLYYCVSIFA